MLFDFEPCILLTDMRYISRVMRQLSFPPSPFFFCRGRMRNLIAPDFHQTRPQIEPRTKNTQGMSKASKSGSIGGPISLGVWQRTGLYAVSTRTTGRFGVLLSFCLSRPDLAHHSWGHNGRVFSLEMEIITRSHAMRPSPVILVYWLFFLLWNGDWKVILFFASGRFRERF